MLTRIWFRQAFCEFYFLMCLISSSKLFDALTLTRSSKANASIGIDINVSSDSGVVPLEQLEFSLKCQFTVWSRQHFQSNLTNRMSFVNFISSQPCQFWLIIINRNLPLGCRVTEQNQIQQLRTQHSIYNFICKMSHNKNETKHFDDELVQLFTIETSTILHQSNTLHIHSFVHRMFALRHKFINYKKNQWNISFNVFITP